MTRKSMISIVAALAIIAVIAAGAVAYAFLKPTAEASAPISAMPLTASTNTPAVEVQQIQATATTAPQKPATETPASAPADAQPTATQAPAAAAGSGGMLFEIAPDRSQARFTINEILNGSPKTVIGTTNQVSGQIEVDAQTPANSRVGVIQVNARTLSTDNEFRNRAIKNRILLTDSNEFITFTPTALSGMPATVALNQPFKFQITGDLTIKGVTKTVTFDAEITPISETEMNGLASTVVAYEDFGISIPNVQSVTGVDKDVKLEIEFVAVKK